MSGGDQLTHPVEQVDYDVAALGAVGSLAGALAAARPKFKTVEKARKVEVTTKAGKTYSYRYADLADHLDGVVEALSEEGLAVSQIFAWWQSRLFLITVLMHTSGEVLKSVYPLQLHDDPKQMGGAITYARRHSLTSLLAIAADEEDDPRRAGERAPEDEAATESFRGEEGPASLLEELLEAASASQIPKGTLMKRAREMWGATRLEDLNDEMCVELGAEHGLELSGVPA